MNMPGLTDAMIFLAVSLLALVIVTLDAARRQVAEDRKSDREWRVLMTAVEQARADVTQDRR